LNLRLSFWLRLLTITGLQVSVGLSANGRADFGLDGIIHTKLRLKRSPIDLLTVTTAIKVNSMKPSVKTALRKGIQSDVDRHDYAMKQAEPQWRTIRSIINLTHICVYAGTATRCRVPVAGPDDDTFSLVCTPAGRA
jgi:hypothetical protein